MRAAKPGRITPPKTPPANIFEGNGLLSIRLGPTMHRCRPHPQRLGCPIIQWVTCSANGLAVKDSRKLQSQKADSATGSHSF